MSRNSSGTYSQPGGTSAVSGAIIDPTAFNSLVSDMGAELTNSLDRGGRGALTADMNAGGFKVTNAGTPTVSTDLVTKAYADLALKAASNLSDLANAGTARTNLGLGGAAVLNVGTAAGTVAGGDSGVPAGSLLAFAGAAAPTGWLLSAGQAISRTTYAALFTALGTVHGAGDGSTTFNLPDLRGRAPHGVDNMGGSAANRVTNGASGITGTTLGATGGAETHTLTIGQMPAHNHDPIQSGSGNGTTSVYTAFATTPFNVSATSNSNLTTQGGGGAHNNMSPTIMLNYIIKI